MFQLSKAIAICILLHGTLAHSSADQDKVLPQIAEEPLNIANQCNGYCFSVIKPILDHFCSLKEGYGFSNELRDKIHWRQNILGDTVKDLQSQLKEKEILIKEKDERIHGLHSLEDTIKDLQSQLENTKSQLKEKETLIKEKDERLHDLQVQLNSTTARFSEIRDHLKTSNHKDVNLPNTCPSDGPNGTYQIKLPYPPFKVSCESGWTVVLSRFDGSENFNRNWSDYRNGFEDLNGEFFIGLEKLHLMTQSQPHELYIRLRNVTGSTAFAKYDHFVVGNEEEAYELKSLGEYSGTAGDSLDYSRGAKFSTVDRDNDISDGECAGFSGGGWWYKICAYCRLTGKYYKNGRRQESESNGIYWRHWHDLDYNASLTFAQMMIRPKTT